MPLRTFQGRFSGIGRSTGKRESKKQDFKQIEQFVKVRRLLDGEFDGMNKLFDKYRFPEDELLPMSAGLADLIRNVLAKD